MGADLGAYHSAEVSYVFDVPLLGVTPLPASDLPLAEVIRGYWGRFARVTIPTATPRRPGRPTPRRPTNIWCSTWTPSPREPACAPRNARSGTACRRTEPDGWPTNRAGGRISPGRMSIGSRPVGSRKRACTGGQAPGHRCRRLRFAGRYVLQHRRAALVPRCNGWNGRRIRARNRPARSAMDRGGGAARGCGCAVRQPAPSQRRPRVRAACAHWNDNGGAAHLPGLA